jgi:2-dehydropantoate 2-reductase
VGGNIMKVAIIGGGAIGLLMACLLERKQVHTAIYCRTEKQASFLRENGLIYKKEGMEKVIATNAYSIDSFAFEEDVILICVKQTALAELQKVLLSDLSEGKTLLFLQNGMSHLELMEDLAGKRRMIWAGVAEHGVMKEYENAVFHAGEGRIRIAPVSQNTDYIWQELFGETSRIERNDGYIQMLSEKLLMNAAINPVTALLKIENGMLLENPHYLNMMEYLFDEALRVLELQKQKNRLLEDLYRICRNTKNNRSSMLRDIDSGRKTEIDSISGYIISHGEKKGIDTPKTRMMYESIKGIEWEG